MGETTNIKYTEPFTKLKNKYCFKCGKKGLFFKDAVHKACKYKKTSTEYCIDCGDRLTLKNKYGSMRRHCCKKCEMEHQKKNRIRTGYFKNRIRGRKHLKDEVFALVQGLPAKQIPERDLMRQINPRFATNFKPSKASLTRMLNADPRMEFDFKTRILKVKQ